jgi:excisionase family DNA binding protein
MTTTTREATVRDGLLTLDEAAQFLAVSRRTIYSLILSGRLSSTKIGKSRRVPKQSVIRLAAESLFVVARDGE